MSRDQKQTELTHLDARGGVRMVNVGDKEATLRRAVAEGAVAANAELIQMILADEVAKGNLLETAKIAGIGAAKRTDELIPLCHSLPLDHTRVEAWVDGSRIRLRATTQTHAKTGVEMEALTAVAVAALTVIDMGKAVDPAMTIESIRLIEKTGGRRGDFRAAPSGEPS